MKEQLIYTSWNGVRSFHSNQVVLDGTDACFEMNLRGRIDLRRFPTEHSAVESNAAKWDSTPATK